MVISDNSYALRFPIEEVSEMKKVSRGEKCMKLNDGELIDGVYLVRETPSVQVRGRELAIGRLKGGHRGGRGSKVR